MDKRVNILFLDDSYARRSKYFGLGGFCLNANEIPALSADILKVRKKYRIPNNVEIKWSPPPDHFLRTKFPYSRSDLYKELIAALVKYNVRIICAIHGLKHCYGAKIHGWGIEKTSIWAASEQLKFLGERFQKTFLEPEDELGLILADKYSSRSGDNSILSSIALLIGNGTRFQRLDRIILPPVTVDSRYYLPIQVADTIIGAVVSYLSNGVYSDDLIRIMAPKFAYNTYPGSISFSATFTGAVLGVGLKLFPLREMLKDSSQKLISLDAQFSVSNQKGIYPILTR